jgi:3-deoxy-D-manno-octulosonate 8-phosphate phosphatase KdsC-like HAD superfamily phosphatase
MTLPLLIVDGDGSVFSRGASARTQNSHDGIRNRVNYVIENTGGKGIP